MAEQEAGAKSNYELVLDGLKQAGRWVVTYLPALALLIALTGLILTCWTLILRPLLHRKVVMYTGAPAGGSREDGARIKRHFADAPWWPPFHYEIETRTSDGFKENRSRVQEASSGELIIGFDQDGFLPKEGTAVDVGTLVPLGELHLHIVAKRKAMIGPPDTTAETPATFDELATRYLQPDKGVRTRWKLYLGPPDSGSRQVAEAVLSYFRIDPDEVDIGDHLSWAQAYQLLRDGESKLLAVIDVCEAGSAGMAKRAGYGELKLLGLAKPDGLATHRERINFQSRKFPAGAYHQEFCPNEVTTLSTRRLVVCPANMPDADASRLAHGIRLALRDKLLPDERDRPNTPPGEKVLLVPIHPAARNLTGEPGRELLQLVLGNLGIAGLWVGGFLLFVLRRQLLPGVLGRSGPVIGPIPDGQQVVAGEMLTVPFTVSDPQAAADTLTVSRATSDADLLPESAVQLLGRGQVRSVVLTPPPNAYGDVSVSLIVRNPAGRTGHRSFVARIIRQFDAAAPQHPPQPPAAPAAGSVGRPPPVILNLFGQIDRLDQEERLRRPTDPAAADDQLRRGAGRVRDRIAQARRDLGPDYEDKLSEVAERLKQVVERVRPSAAPSG